MTCPTCQAEHSHPVAYCPRCGALLASTLHADWDAEGDLIEGTIVEYGQTGDVLPLNSPDASGDGEQSSVVQASNPSTSLVVARPALPSLPVRLWRQPVVRAVARAGAGALALTLGMRLLRGALSRPGARSELASSALPAIRHLLDSRAPAHRSPLSASSEQDGDIVETFIYMRRVVRRRLPRL